MAQETWYDLAVRELSERTDPVVEKLIEAEELVDEAELAAEAAEAAEAAAQVRPKPEPADRT